MKGSNFQHRQELADLLEQFLMKSEIVFSEAELSVNWMQDMIQQANSIQNKIAVLHYLQTLDSEEVVRVMATNSINPSNSPIEQPENAMELVVDQAEEVLEELDEELDAIAKRETEKELQESDIHGQVEEVPATPNESPELVEKVLLTEGDLQADKPTEFEEVAASDDHPDLALSSTEKVEVNDMHKMKDSLADKLRVKAIAKLAESITLNERFLFANELFNGNMEAFKRALNELDHIASLADAKRFIDVQLKVENEWDINSDSVKSFITLVERRFN